jgi:hypothetical protein
MEVHHHPQLHHEPKPWKEYLLEGLMIFLAVFMGFIAENIREHFADKEREKKSIESMVRAMASDTVQLHQVIFTTRRSVAYIDSFITLKKNDVTQTPWKEKFYSYAINGFGNDDYFKANDGALMQLNASGTLRLISDRNTIDSIYKYQFLYKQVLAQESDDYLAYKELVARLSRLADLTVFRDPHTVHKSYDAENRVLFKFSAKLPKVGTDKNALIEIYNYAVIMGGGDDNYNHLLNEQLQCGRNTIAYLKKEYGLE